MYTILINQSLNTFILYLQNVEKHVNRLKIDFDFNVLLYMLHRGYCVWKTIAAIYLTIVIYESRSSDLRSGGSSAVTAAGTWSAAFVANPKTILLLWRQRRGFIIIVVHRDCRVTNVVGGTRAICALYDDNIKIF